MKTRDKATETARRRWNRTALIYDPMMAFMERVIVRKWRALLWSRVETSRVLEIAVGTGKNFPYYPDDAEITAVDFSENMLEHAKDRARKQRVKVNLQQMDVQNLEFEDNTFDTVAATFTFCSIPDQVRGIREVERVTKPGGKVVILEQDLSSKRILRWLLNLANPLLAWITGANFNRRPVENIARSGLKLEKVTELWGGRFKLIEARKR
ncbi:MAG: class I SAM-dependent methyltransferase [Dehalococcoidia bacterium]|nr:MAG: class I SAM-dependent methyltransferase [Dehalococcoidia bacterium]